MNSKTKSLRQNYINPRMAPLRPSKLIRAQVDQINKGLAQVAQPHVPKCQGNGNVPQSDSDEDRLCIDIDDEESKPSISDSEEDDEEVDGKDPSLRDIKRKRMKSWWAKNFSQKSGDPSKVIEVTLEDDDSTDFEVISPKVKPKPLNNQKMTEKINKCNQYFQMKLNHQMRNTMTNIKQNYIQLSKELELKKNLLKRRELSLYAKKNHEHSLECDTTFKAVNKSKTVITKIKPKDEFFCFFCSQILKSSESAKSHYLDHLGVFLECGECHQKFDSLPSYRKHNSQHLDRNKMINLEHFMYAKNWSDRFVDYMERHEELISEYCPNNDRVLCPVCQNVGKLYDNIETDCQKYENSLKSSNNRIDEQFVTNHLHQHLQYFPYECIDCRFQHKMTDFCLNRTARQHLLDVHNIENAFDLKENEFSTYFDRKKPIKELDLRFKLCMTFASKGIVFCAKNGKKGKPKIVSKPQ